MVRPTGVKVPRREGDAEAVAEAEGVEEGVVEGEAVGARPVRVAFMERVEEKEMRGEKVGKSGEIVGTPILFVGD